MLPCPLGSVTNRDCDDFDETYTYNDFLQPMSLYSSKELLFDRQQNIFKIAMFYLPDQSVVTKVCLLTCDLKRTILLCRLLGMRRCQRQTRSVGLEEWWDSSQASPSSPGWRSSTGSGSRCWFIGRTQLHLQLLLSQVRTLWSRRLTTSKMRFETSK